MSLVDYASSSGDEEEEKDPPMKDRDEASVQRHDSKDDTHNQSSTRSVPPLVSASQSVTTSHERLPDASLLFDEPFSFHGVSGSDHSSRVAAAMAEGAARKRESNGSHSSDRVRKTPKSNLPHSRNVPDTVGNLLIPPQLRGRSNVVTEDIGKLFLRRNSNQPQQRSPEQAS